MSFVSIKSKKAPDALPPVDLDLEVPMGELRVSDEAAERIRELRKTEVDAQFLRVGIAGGGCSGFSYTYAFEKEAKPTDLIFKNGTIPLTHYLCGFVATLANSSLNYSHCLRNVN